MKAGYPEYSAEDAEAHRYRDAESEMGILMDIITGIRNVRGEMNISPSLSLRVLILSEDTIDPPGGRQP